MQIDDNHLSSIIGWIAGGIASLCAWAIRGTMARLRKLEQCTVQRAELREVRDEMEIIKDKMATREELKEHSERSTQERTELRESIMKIFDRLDSIRDTMAQCLKNIRP
jgi:hypothetical protein